LGGIRQHTKLEPRLNLMVASAGSEKTNDLVATIEERTKRLLKKTETRKADIREVPELTASHWKVVTV